MSTTPCRAEYVRPGGRQRGDRIVRCHLPAGHPGEHEEADTEITWTEGANVADYTPDPALVELAARAAYDADTAQIIGDGQLTWGEQDEQCHDWFRTIATAVLSALATEGRLLPGPVLAVHTSDGRVYHPSDVQFAVGPWLPVPDTEETP